MPGGDKELEARLAVQLAARAMEAEAPVAALRVIILGVAALVYIGYSAAPGEGGWNPGAAASVPWLADATAAVAVAYGLWMYFARPYRQWPSMVSGYVSSFLDGALLLSWIRATGGAASPFVPLVYLSIFAVGFRYRGRQVTAATLLYALAYLCMLAVDGALAARPVETFARLSYMALSGVVAALVTRQVLDQARATSRALTREQRVRTDSAASEARARFLAEASKALAASLDYEETLKNVARLVVPTLADHCVVDLLEEDGAFRRVAEAGRTPADEPLLRELRDYPALEGGLAARALRTAAPAVVPELHDEALAELSAGRDAGYARVLRALDLRTMVAVPLRVHGRSLGTMTFGISGRSYAFTDEELLLSEELALRAALAIEHARLYRDAQEAVRTRDEFLSIASHELRTPLNVMMLQTDGLLRQSRREGDTRQLPAYERIKRQVNRLGDLVESLLDVSRVTAGRLTLELGDMELEPLVNEVVGRLREDAARSGTTITIAGNGAIVGHWDRMRIDQIVTNLLSNAIKYGAGKPVDVRVDRAGDMARLEVRDQGIGIGAEDQARIFERFERAVSARHYGGFGLGLWIVRQIARAHGGEISIRSRLGEGSIFAVELPLEGPKPPSSNPPPPLAE